MGCELLKQNKATQHNRTERCLNEGIALWLHSGSALMCKHYLESKQRFFFYLEVEFFKAKKKGNY